MTITRDVRKPKPFKSLTHLALVKTADDPGKVMEIVPTMRNITTGGERYFRMDHCRRYLPDGTECAVYLWDGYGKALLAEIEAKKAAEQAGESE